MISHALFDCFGHGDSSSRCCSESAFHFLDRSDRPGATAIRKTIEQWFLRYPSVHQARFRADFRSANDLQHRAAFFELLLHELLLCLGYSLDVHPVVNLDRGRRPDFLVTSAVDPPFVLEAVLASEESKRELAASSRIEAVIEQLNRRLKVRDFFLGVRIEGVPRTPVPSDRVLRFLKFQIDRLNASGQPVVFVSADQGLYPRWPYEHDGCVLEFFPIPRTVSSKTGDSGRPIGLITSDARWRNASAVIKDAVRKKSNRYGDLGQPYVVAVNVWGELGLIDRSDIVSALFGNEQWIVSKSSGEWKVDRCARALNGVWTSGAGPLCTRVSAVLVGSLVSPWSIHNSEMYLCHNPWAKKPYCGALTRLPQAVPRDGHVVWTEGDSLSRVLGLPEGWPGA